MDATAIDWSRHPSPLRPACRGCVGGAGGSVSGEQTACLVCGAPTVNFAPRGLVEAAAERSRNRSQDAELPRDGGIQPWKQKKVFDPSMDWSEYFESEPWTHEDTLQSAARNMESCSPSMSRACEWALVRIAQLEQALKAAGVDPPQTPEDAELPRDGG